MLQQRNIVWVKEFLGMDKNKGLILRIKLGGTKEKDRDDKKYLT